MTLYCGTSGFSFKEWKGSFYPARLPAKDMLAFYAERLPAVEINNTFYRMPRRALLEGWVSQVPAGFRFALKAPRRITHSKQLAGCEEEASHLFTMSAALGERLGCVLFQLPPHARADAARLDAFLVLVPDRVAVAFEFRHPSWEDARIDEILAQHSAARVVVDSDSTVPARLPATAAHAYVRLRAEAYDDASLAAWKSRCTKFRQAFVFFKHEEGGVAPACARRMLAS